MASLRRRLALRAALVSSAALVLGACIAVAPEGIHRQTDQGDAGEGGTLVVDMPPPENLPPDAGTNSDPHAVLGAKPSHGPFKGGQRVLVTGKGFSSQARVWFGDAEVDPQTIVPIDPLRVQVISPPGKAGPVAVTVQNGDDASTKRSLEEAYTYDALYAAPDSGPVPGGNTIQIVGQETTWDETTTAKIGGKPCDKLIVLSPTLLSCTVPAGAPGAKTIAVTSGGVTTTVLDAYTYADSDNGYKGGLSGAPLAGTLKVLVYDNFSGDPIPDAHVVIGSQIGTAIQSTTDAQGVAVINNDTLKGPVTVTVAAYCHSPISFIDEPVDTVTTYLDPVQSPACASSGDPPPVGGKPVDVGNVTGQLVWPSGVEFKKGPWANVPVPIGNERRAAYVFYATDNANAVFQLPSENAAVLEDAPGDVGYAFTLVSPVGNRAIYALAGIEDRSISPPKFTAYVMGIANGVPVLPNQITEGIYVNMLKTLDQALSWDVKAPLPGAKGPDRLRATVSIMLGNDGFALLPIGQKQPLLPVQGLLSFVGVPSLDGDLKGSSYSSSARAQTGSLGNAPLSVIGRILSTTTSKPVDVGGFVNLPQIVEPKVSGAWDGKHLAVDFPPGGAPVDLTVYDISSGNGLVHWTVAVPKGSNAIELPDLNGFPQSALPVGPVSIGVYGAHIDNFDYGKLLYRNLRPAGMTAYSLDYFNAHL